MTDTVHVTLAAWGNFYLTTGAAAATLTGLQFVVQSILSANRRRSADDENPDEGIAAFGTPTVVHLAIALVLSAVLSAPWPAYGGLRATLALIAVGALVYAAIVLRRARRQRSYTATAYDWFWHTVLPTVAYVALLVAAPLLGGHETVALFTVAAATLLLVCVGIHNAWDTVTWIVVSALRSEGKSVQ